MRRILIENARRKQATSGGGQRAWNGTLLPSWPRAESDLLALIQRGTVGAARPAQGQAGRTALLRRADERPGGRGPRDFPSSADRQWSFARAWLRRQLGLAQATPDFNRWEFLVLKRLFFAWKSGGQDGPLPEVGHERRGNLPRGAGPEPPRSNAASWNEHAAATRPCGRRSKRCCGPTSGPAAFSTRPAAGSRTRPSMGRSASGPGTVIGPYKLLQEIGEGGMGTVFMAEQTEPVRRKVALKIIKPGHGLPAGHRPLRGRAAGPGADGPPEHRQGPRRRHHRRPAGPTSSWSWSRACRSPSTATSTT